MTMLSTSFTRRLTNAVMLGLSGLCTVLVVSVLVGILGYLLAQGASSISWSFLTQLPHTTDDGRHVGGMANSIVGSAEVLLIATLVGVPIGFLAGVYLAEYSGKTFAFLIRYVVDLLNGVPSIVIGIVAYALLVEPFNFHFLAGGVALGIMMIPIAVRTTEEFLRAVPNSVREGAMALGATKAKTIFTVVIPAAISGLVSGMMLNLARVAGETAPVLFTAGDSQLWNFTGLSERMATLPVTVFNYATASEEDLHKQAWAAGFVLLTLILAVNVTARLIIARGPAAQRR